MRTGRFVPENSSKQKGKGDGNCRRVCARASKWHLPKGGEDPAGGDRGANFFGAEKMLSPPTETDFYTVSAEQRPHMRRQSNFSACWATVSKRVRRPASTSAVASIVAYMSENGECLSPHLRSTGVFRVRCKLLSTFYGRIPGRHLQPRCIGQIMQGLEPGLNINRKRKHLRVLPRIRRCYPSRLDGARSRAGWQR